MRKLASIQTVRELVSIAGADRIEVARMRDNAWQCVVKKGEFKPNDLACYCEIDSLVPVRPEFEFITSKGTKTLADGSVGARIKTIRLRGTLSQGLLLPITFPEFAGLELKSGDDVTDLIGVKLYEAPVSASLAGCARGNFPGWIRKTDQERCISGDTIISTESGNKTIKEICESNSVEKVLSLNHSTNKKEFKEIIKKSVMKNNGNWFLIKTESGKELKITGNHRIWVESLQCYRRVDELTAGIIVNILEKDR